MGMVYVNGTTYPTASLADTPSLVQNLASEILPFFGFVVIVVVHQKSSILPFWSSLSISSSTSWPFLTSSGVIL